MSDHISRTFDRIRTRDEFELQQKELPEAVRKMIAAPPSMRNKEKAAKLDRVRQQLEDYYERLCTDLGELGGWLSRHRTTKKLPVQGYTRTWTISHSFPGQGLHDLHLLLVIEAMTGPAVSGWLVVPMGPQAESEKFDADDLQGALAFAATFVDPF